MAVVTVEHTRNGRKLLNYILNPKPHYSDQYVKERNMYLGAIDCPVMCPEEAMPVLWKNTRCKNQLFSVVQSFRDMDYRNTDDVLAVHEAGMELAKRLLKKLDVKRQVLVATQADGEGHHLHNHILINNCDEEGHGIPHGIYVGKVMDINDQLVEERLTKERELQDELVAQKNRWQKGDYRHSYEPKSGIPKKNKLYNLSMIDAGLNHDLQNQHNYRTKKHQQHLEQPDNRYIIRVVKAALDTATNKEKFVENLKQNGVEIKIRKKQQSINWHAKNLSFRRVGGKHALRSTTIDKEWTAQRIVKRLEENRLNQLVKQQRQARLNQEVVREMQEWEEKQKQKEVKTVAFKQQESTVDEQESVKAEPQTSHKPGWPQPVSLGDRQNGCVDPDSIRMAGKWTNDQIKFEQQLEAFRNERVPAYQKFSKKRSKKGLVKISFQEYFAAKLIRFKRTSVVKFLKSLLKDTAKKIARKLNELKHSYVKKFNQSDGANGKEKVMDVNTPEN